MAGIGKAPPAGVKAALLLAALLVVSALAAAGAAQRPVASAAVVYDTLANGSFESSPGDGTPEGWLPATSKAFLGRTMQPVQEGSYAGLVVTRSTSAVNAYQPVRVSPGHSYQLSGYILPSDPAVAEVWLRLVWFRSADASSGAIGYVDARPGAGAGAFRLASTGPVQAPAEARSARVQLMVRSLTGATAAGYFDRVLLVADPGGVAPPPATPTPTPTPTPSAGALVVGSGGYPSLGQALAAASPGQVIRLRAGTYREAVMVGKAVTIEAYGDGPVWLDGQCSSQAVVTVRASDVVLRNLGIRRSAGAGVLIEDGAARVTVETSTIQDFNCGDAPEAHRAGIAAWYPGPGLRLVGNVIRYRVELPGGPRGGGNGIWFKSSSDRPSGGGHYIGGNLVVGGWDGLGGEPEGDPRGAFDRDTLIEANVVRHCADDGIQVEGGGQNVRVVNNEVSGCGTGLAFAAPLSGPLYLEGNYVHDLVMGPQGNLFCFKVGNATRATVYLTGNRCLVGPGADGLKQTNGGLGPIVSRRNVLQVGRYALELADTPPAGSSFDYDCLHSSDPERFIKWGGVRYGDLASFQRATGQEANGRQSEDCSWLGLP